MAEIKKSTSKFYFLGCMCGAHLARILTPSWYSQGFLPFSSWRAWHCFWTGAGREVAQKWVGYASSVGS